MNRCRRYQWCHLKDSPITHVSRSFSAFIAKSPIRQHATAAARPTARFMADAQWMMWLHRAWNLNTSTSMARIMFELPALRCKVEDFFVFMSFHAARCLDVSSDRRTNTRNSIVLGSFTFVAIHLCLENWLGLRWNVVSAMPRKKFVVTRFQNIRVRPKLAGRWT